MDDTKKPCMKKCIISFIAVFAFLFIYDWLVHGQLLMADYQATVGTWRSQEEMQALFGWCIAYHAALAAVITCFFKKFKKAQVVCICGTECQCSPTCPCKGAADCNSRCPIKTGGVCFGMKVGLLLALSHSVAYLWLPIPGALAIKWFIAYLVQGIVAGAILGMISGGSSKGGCAATSCSTKA
jgi:hypothetical protein